MTKRPIVLTSVLALALASVASEAAAGPTRINSCRTISNTGSYVLSRNINGSAAAGSCLIVEAPFATINLNGFSIGGPGIIGNAAFGHGIEINAQGVTVRNGTVTGWQSGIVSGFAQGVTIIGVRSVANESVGIGVGQGGIVKDSTAIGNIGDGITFKEGSTLVNNVSQNNGGGGFAANGFQGDCPSTLIGNTAIGNGSDNFNLDTTNGTCTEAHNTAP